METRGNENDTFVVASVPTLCLLAPLLDVRINLRFAVQRRCGSGTDCPFPPPIEGAAVMRG